MFESLQEAYRTAEGRMAQVCSARRRCTAAARLGLASCLPAFVRRDVCRHQLSHGSHTPQRATPPMPRVHLPQELLRRHVLKLLRVWRGWFIFSDDYLNGLQASWLRCQGAGSLLDVPHSRALCCSTCWDGLALAPLHSLQHTPFLLSTPSLLATLPTAPGHIPAQRRRCLRPCQLPAGV